MLERVWRKGNALALLVGCKLIQPLWKKVWRLLKKLGIKPPYDPAIPLLGIYPEETKIEKDTCIPLFIEALFTIARAWSHLDAHGQTNGQRSCGTYTHGILSFSSIPQSCPTLYDPMNCSTPGLPVQHQLPVYPNSCPLSRWCRPTISSCPQSFPASGSFQMSQLFASGGQSIGVSASTSVLPMNTQDWSLLGWTG